MTWKVLELFCGIGGCASALDPADRVVAAIDQSELALSVYRHNHDHRVRQRNIVGLKARDLPAADLWWMSPPCQPYTIRGKRLDLDDKRAQSLVKVMGLIEEVQPRAIALENVPGFESSRARALLGETLERVGYRVIERELCPTALGIPNIRRRFYLAASLDRQPTWQVLPQVGKPLAAYLDDEPDPSLWVEPDLMARFGTALHLVDPTRDDAVSACFTSAYTRSPVYSGSYLVTPTGPRRFSPAEGLRLLHFPDATRLPDTLPKGKAWPLVGNSMCVAVVREVLEALKPH